MSALILMSGFLAGVATTAVLITNISEWGMLYLPALICLAVGVFIVENHNSRG